MDVELFDFSLPADRVAQHPAAQRDQSRLMALPRVEGPPTHHTFSDLPGLLRPDDLLVLNDTRVVPARLRAWRPSGGQVELLVLPDVDGPAASGGQDRDCFLKASRRPRPHEELRLPDGASAILLEDHGDGRARLRFQGPPVRELLAAHGSVPLPPYIRRQADDERHGTDPQRYQTVYAQNEGAVAAPTAGLHFTRETLDAVEAAGVNLAWVTLHVGPGTFRPVTARRAEDHRVDPEWFVLPEATAEAVSSARSRGGRVFACGTTVVRTLEGQAAGANGVRAGGGWCDLFIYPGHRFTVVDGMITNFHLPRSSLLMLVSAMAGRERMLQAYGEAIAAGYRFYSYGDAMLIHPGQLPDPMP